MRTADRLFLARALRLLVPCLALAGCGTSTPMTMPGGNDCATQCTGCCDSLGRCQTGDVPTACGVSGLRCAACKEDEQCQAGQCVYVCEMSCAGCCAGNECFPGNEATSCGRAGMACQACGVDQACSNGGCLDKCANCGGCCDKGNCRPGTNVLECGAGGDPCRPCGKNDSCATGACMLDLSKTLKLVVTSMKFTPKNGGSNWDVDGSAPDPYVTATVDGTPKSSMYKQDPAGDTVQFDHSFGSFTIEQLLARWLFEVYDDDVGNDDYMAGCTAVVTPDDLDAGYVEWSCGAAIPFIRFEFQE